MHLILSIALGSDGNLVHPPDYQRDATAHVAKLRADLMATYDKTAFPTSTRVSNASAAGTDVSVQLRFYKLTHVALDKGELEAKVWLRMKWYDERLAWDESDYGGITQVEYAAASHVDKEHTEIWLPDITPYNAKFGLTNTFEPAVARVSSSGLVTWSRPGNLVVLCRFSGLMMFPLEESISCALEIGGWYRSGGFQGVLPYFTTDDKTGKDVPNCATGVPAYEETSAYSYTEYEIKKLDCETEVYMYDCCPNEPWPVLKIRLHIKRSFPFYVIGFIMPLTIFTYASFTVFFMADKSGERLGLGVTLMLVVEVTKYTVQTWLPKCGELLWMDLFIFTNTIFTALSLLWSVVVLAAHYSEDVTVIPKEVRALFTGWWPFIKYARRRMKGTHGPRNEGVDPALKRLDQLAGFNLINCGPLHLAPALGLKWVRLDARPISFPAEWTPLNNRKLTRALMDTALGDGAVLDLTLAQFERFELMGVVSNRCYIEVMDRSGNAVVFRPVPSSTRLAKADSVAVAAVEGPPDLLKALGAEKHQITLKLSPIAGTKTDVFAFSCPALEGEISKQHKEQAKMIYEKSKSERAREPVAAACQLLLFGGFIHFDENGDVSHAETIELPSGESPSDDQLQLRMNGPHVYAAEPPMAPGAPCCALRTLAASGRLSPWAQDKLSQAGRFSPIPIEDIERLGARSFAWVAPQEMRISPSHGKHGYTGCEEGAFIYCTGPNGTGHGAFMRLFSTRTPTVKVQVKCRVTLATSPEIMTRKFSETIPRMTKVFMLKDDIGRWICSQEDISKGTRVQDLALTFDGKTLSESDTLEQCTAWRLREPHAGTLLLNLEAHFSNLTLGGPLKRMTAWRPQLSKMSFKSMKTKLGQWSESMRLRRASPMRLNLASLQAFLAHDGAATSGYETFGEDSNASSRSLFYELLFYQADSDGNDFIPFEDARQLLAFLKSGMQPTAREKLLMHCESGDTRDGKLDRDEFIEMCREAFADLSMDMLNDGLKDHSTALQVLKERHRVKMGRIGRKLDRFALFTFPLIYSFALFVLATSELGDNYSSEDGITDLEMRAWIHKPMKVSDVGIILIPVVAGLLGALAISSILTNIGRVQAEKEGRLKGKQRTRLSQALAPGVAPAPALALAPAPAFARANALLLWWRRR